MVVAMAVTIAALNTRLIQNNGSEICTAARSSPISARGKRHRNVTRYCHRLKPIEEPYFPPSAVNLLITAQTNADSKKYRLPLYNRDTELSHTFSNTHPATP